MSAFGYLDKLTNVHNALCDANTTTAVQDLSEGMNERVKNIVMDDPAVRKAKDVDHPMIWVWMEDASSDFEEIGAAGVSGAVTKRKKVNYRILATVHKPGMIAEHSKGLEQVYMLADNIETIFRTEWSLSNTAMWCNPAETTFLGPVDLGGSYIKGVTIRLETEYLWR
jgi:hypothetical protein